jgi:hypothetical protein
MGESRLISTVRRMQNGGTCKEYEEYKRQEHERIVQRKLEQAKAESQEQEKTDGGEEEHLPEDSSRHE